jgi:lipid A 3-O-deacylase
MKLFLKIIGISLLSLNLNAEVFSVFLENDVIDGKDKHYTNGTSFMYLSNNDTNNSSKYNNSFFDFVSKIPTFNNETKYQSLGMTFSHHTFTPDDSEKVEKIVGDVPYAGVATIDFILYKWEEDFFHEYIMTLGVIGQSTLAEKFQQEYHHITGNNETNGWNNQLKDDFLYNFTYSYGFKAFKHEFDYGKMDIINNFRIDLGNYNRALMVGAMIRYGNNYPNNFNTVGRLLGANENKLLNLDSKANKDLGWSLSYGLGYSYTDYFYVNNYDKSYELDKLKDTLMQVISFDTYFEKFVLSLTYKTSYFVRINNNTEKENWGGVNIAYLF